MPFGVFPPNYIVLSLLKKTFLPPYPLAQFGIGVSFYYSFGIPYVDDNSGKTQSPLLLSLVTSARTLGPTAGYVLGGAFLSLYVYPARRPGDIDQDDPRWGLLLLLQLQVLLLLLLLLW